MANVVLCGANSYEKKYYLNPDFGRLPESIKQEIQIMCVEHCEYAGGTITMEFTDDGTLLFNVRADDSDFMFDEIESGIIISKYQRQREELLEQLEMFYKVMFLSMNDINE